MGRQRGKQVGRSWQGGDPVEVQRLQVIQEADGVGAGHLGQEHRDGVLAATTVAHAEQLVDVDGVGVRPHAPGPFDGGGRVDQRAVDVEQNGINLEPHPAMLVGPGGGGPVQG